ncbi:MAG: cyclic nucleotide-binding domain-containing protein [Ignavibacteriae bacterium]|nr:cyclic nucleotide-binding domain-containing protein [Ignavibacteriota bacterium]
MAGTKSSNESTIWKNIFSKKVLPEGSTEKLLSTIPAFSDLSFFELREVAQIVHKREYNADEPVFYQGDPGLGMYIIQEGRVLITIEDKDGNEKDLATLGDGDFFGEVALLDESPRSATAVCKTDCQLIGFFRPDLFEIIEKNPALGIKIVQKLAEIVAQRLRVTDKEVSKLKSELDTLTSGRKKKPDGKDEASTKTEKGSRTIL